MSRALGCTNAGNTLYKRSMYILGFNTCLAKCFRFSDFSCLATFHISELSSISYTALKVKLLSYWAWKSQVFFYLVESWLLSRSFQLYVYNYWRLPLQLIILNWCICKDYYSKLVCNLTRLNKTYSATYEFEVEGLKTKCNSYPSHKG